MNSPRNNEPTAEEIQAITGRTDVKHVATADTARGLVEAVKEAEAAPAVTFERSSTGHTDATANGKTVAWYSPKRLGWDRKVTHYRAVVCGGARGLWFGVAKHGGAHAARMAARAWICEKVAEKYGKPDIRDTFDKPYRTVSRALARTGDVASWVDPYGRYIRAFVVVMASGRVFHKATDPNSGDYYEDVPQGARFKRLLPYSPPAVALTPAQRELVLEALEDSADGWELAAEDNRNLNHNDGSHAEQCSRDARDTLNAIKSQLK